MFKTILGLHDGHNAAAALLDNGRIVAAVQEERLTGTKNQGGIPRHAISNVLSMTGIASSVIRKVAFSATATAPFLGTLVVRAFFRKRDAHWIALM